MKNLGKVIEMQELLHLLRELGFAGKPNWDLFGTFFEDN